MAALLLAACNSSDDGATPPVTPASIPAGFQVSDTEHWRFGYPAGWTTDESTGGNAEHILNVRGPNVTPLAKCFAHALWKDDYPGGDYVKATRAFLVTYEAEQPLIVDQEFSAPGAKEALRLEFIHPGRASDGSVVRLHDYQLNFLRSDNTAIQFAVTVPVGHEAECQAEQMLKSFTMKATTT